MNIRIKIDRHIKFVVHRNSACWYKRDLAVKTILQHEHSLSGYFELVCTNKTFQGLIWVLLCHRVRGIKFAFDQAHIGDNLACKMLSSAVHDFRHARDRRVHQRLLQCLVVNIRYGRYLLLQKLKHDFALIVESEQCDV